MEELEQHERRGFRDRAAATRGCSLRQKSAQGLDLAGVRVDELFEPVLFCHRALILLGKRGFDRFQLVRHVVRQVENSTRAATRCDRPHLHASSNVQVFSPWHWHFVSTTVGAVPPCLKIDSRKLPSALTQYTGL